jgi:hypothetical protein
LKKQGSSATDSMDCTDFIKSDQSLRYIHLLLTMEIRAKFFPGLDSSADYKGQDIAK